MFHSIFLVSDISILYLRELTLYILETVVKKYTCKYGCGRGE